MLWVIPINDCITTEGVFLWPEEDADILYAMLRQTWGVGDGTQRKVYLEHQSFIQYLLNFYVNYKLHV